MEKKYPSLAEMSGETNSSPRLALNEIQFNGKDGKYVYINKLGGRIRDEKDGKEKYEKIDLGSSVSVVFLRIRRKLRQFVKNGNPLTTNEHNSKHDMLTLFGSDKIIKGTNDELREKFAGLKTNQIVYCLLFKDEGEPELVRMVVKGASLGSNAKEKGEHDFYSYISSFKMNGREDHFYNYFTQLGVLSESGDLGNYYAIQYKEGEEVSPDLMDSDVVPSMQKVYDYITASDEYYKTKNVQQLQKEQDAVEKDDLDTVEYPDEEINADDIPF